MPNWTECQSERNTIPTIDKIKSQSLAKYRVNKIMRIKDFLNVEYCREVLLFYEKFLNSGWIKRKGPRKANFHLNDPTRFHSTEFSCLHSFTIKFESQFN